MASQSEIAAGIAQVNTQLQKVSSESTITLDKVRALEEQIANGDVSPELQAAFDDLKAQVQKVDDLVPDAVPVPGDETPTA